MPPGPVRNRVLRSLAAEDLQRLRPGLDWIAFEAGAVLQEALRPVEALLFIETGFASVLGGQAGRDQTEVALIGPEGLTGLPAMLGTGFCPFRTVANGPGGALRLPVDRPGASDAALRGAVLRFAQVHSTQMAETGRSNARQSVEARLARWLLMAHDRLDGHEILLTHDSLSQRLGVRRPGITVALHVLEGDRMIRARRGAIEILDRDGLLRTANGSYGLPEAEYERLFGAA